MSIVLILNKIVSDSWRECHDVDSSTAQQRLSSIPYFLEIRKKLKSHSENLKKLLKFNPTKSQRSPNFLICFVPLLSLGGWGTKMRCVYVYIKDYSLG